MSKMYEKKHEGKKEHSKHEKSGKKGEKFIKDAIKKPGQLHKDLEVPKGKKIPEKKLEEAAKKPGKVGQRARFAETLEGLNHKKEAAKPRAAMSDKKHKVY